MTTGLLQNFEDGIAAMVMHRPPARPPARNALTCDMGQAEAQALAIDLRIAAIEAKLTTSFSKISLSCDFSGSCFLHHLVGAAKARPMYFNDQVIRGDEAARIGLVNRAVPAAQLAQAAAAWAAELAALPTAAIGYMKRNLNLGAARVAGRCAGRRGRAPGAQLRDRRPQGCRAGLRGKEPAAVCRALVY